MPSSPSGHSPLPSIHARLTETMRPLKGDEKLTVVVFDDGEMGLAPSDFEPAELGLLNFADMQRKVNEKLQSLFHGFDVASKTAVSSSTEAFIHDHYAKQIYQNMRQGSFTAQDVIGLLNDWQRQFQPPQQASQRPVATSPLPSNAARRRAPLQPNAPESSILSHKASTPAAAASASQPAPASSAASASAPTRRWTDVFRRVRSAMTRRSHAPRASFVPTSLPVSVPVVTPTKHSAAKPEPAPKMLGGRKLISLEEAAQKNALASASGAALGASAVDANALHGTVHATKEALPTMHGQTMVSLAKAQGITEVERAKEIGEAVKRAENDPKSIAADIAALDLSLLESLPASIGAPSEA